MGTPDTFTFTENTDTITVASGVYELCGHKVYEIYLDSDDSPAGGFLSIADNGEADPTPRTHTVTLNADDVNYPTYSAETFYLKVKLADYYQIDNNLVETVTPI